MKIVEKIIKKVGKTKSKGSIKKELLNENSSEVENHIYNHSNSSKIFQTKISELEKQIEIFETRAKNDEKYIDNLNKQLDYQNSNVNTLNKLLENQQILALESNRKIQRLESELEERLDLCQEYGHSKKRILPRFACLPRDSYSFKGPKVYESRGCFYAYFFSNSIGLI